jgi:hypothetical protein
LAIQKAGCHQGGILCLGRTARPGPSDKQPDNPHLVSYQHKSILIFIPHIRSLLFELFILSSFKGVFQFHHRHGKLFALAEIANIPGTTTAKACYARSVFLQLVRAVRQISSLR